MNAEELTVLIDLATRLGDRLKAESDRMALASIRAMQDGPSNFYEAISLLGRSRGLSDALAILTDELASYNAECRSEENHL